MEEYRIELYIEKGGKLVELKRNFWIRKKEEKILSEYYNKKIILREW